VDGIDVITSLFLKPTAARWVVFSLWVCAFVCQTFDDYDEIGDLQFCIFFAFSDIFSLQLQLMHYVDICCWVGLGRIRSAYISSGLGLVIENGPTTMYACMTMPVADMVVGPFSITKPNPTHPFTDPTQPMDEPNPQPRNSIGCYTAINFTIFLFQGSVGTHITGGEQHIRLLEIYAGVTMPKL